MPGLPGAAQGSVRTKAIQGVPILPDGAAADLHLGSRGEQFNINIFNGLQTAAVERSYYTGVLEAGGRGTGAAITPVTGTTYLATQALFVVQNTNPVGGPDVILDYAKILIDTVPGGGTFWYIYHAVDNINRYSTGGTAVQLQNADGALAPGVLLYAGNVTATAASGNVRDAGFNLILNGVGVANSSYCIKYGGLDLGAAGTFTTPTTGVAQSTFAAPAIVIPPQSSYVCNEFQTSRATSATIGEMFFGVIVR